MTGSGLTDMAARGAGTMMEFDWAGAFWRRKWMVAVVIATAIGLGYLYFLRLPPLYETTAQIHLIHREAQLPLATLEFTASYEDPISTHIELVRSRMIIGNAVEKFELKSLPEFAGVADPFPLIYSRLRVSRGGGPHAPNPNIINLHYEGRTPEECASVLIGVTQCYQDYLGEAYLSLSKETVDLIERAKDDLLTKLDAKQDEYREIRQSMPLLWRGERGTTVHEMRMGEFERARSEVLLENARLQAEIEAIEASLARGTPREALALAIGQGSTGAAPSLSGRTADDVLFEIELEEKLLLETHGPDHPKVKAIRRKLNIMRDHLAKTGTPKIEPEQSVDLVQLYLDSLRHASSEGEQKLTGLDKLFEQERDAARNLAVHQLQEEMLRADIDRTQQLFNGIVKRLEEINLVKDYGGLKTQIISPPGLGTLVQRSLAIVLAIASLVGLVFGTALVYVIELADASFRSPDDIAHQLGVPIVGHVPLMPLASEKHGSTLPLDQSLCTFHSPKSRLSEAYRAIRTALYFSTRGQECRVIQITSPDPGDGKSTLASNLAVSIAQSGKTVLLIDADFRRPRLHKLFRLPNAVGMSSLIKNDVPLPDVVQDTEVENLSVLPCGPTPHNPSELLSSPRMVELLDVVRGQYDFVLIDTPPLLAVTDPSIVAARVDAVLLTLRISSKARTHSSRAGELLASVGANVLGVVVNAVGARPGYGYGSYHYSDYRYSNGHYSLRSKNGTYYAEDGTNGSAAENSNGRPALTATDRGLEQS